MRLIYLLFFYFLSFHLHATDTTHNKEKVLTIVDGGNLVGYPPYYYYPESATVTSKNLRPRGFLVELIEVAAKDAGFQVKWLSVPFKRAIQMMRNGDADAMYPVLFTKPRSEYMYFKDLELAEECNYLVTLKDSPINFSENLSNFKLDGIVGITDAYSYGKVFDNLINSGKVNTLKVSEDKQLVKLLLSGRIDVALGNQLPLSWQFQKINALEKVKFSQSSLSCAKMHLAFSRQKENFKERSKKLATAIAKINQDKPEGSTEKVDSSSSQTNIDRVSMSLNSLQP